VWAGVDNAWEQEKLEARKMPENGAESPASSARCVRRTHQTPTFLAENELQTHLDKILYITKTLARTKKL
jgi:hypothetical protein